MQRELESYRDGDTETEYLADVVLEMGEEYRRSTDTMRKMREDHKEKMSDLSISEILNG